MGGTQLGSNPRSSAAKGSLSGFVECLVVLCPIGEGNHRRKFSIQRKVMPSINGE